MAPTSYTSEYDERKDYKEALLDRIAELVIANLQEIRPNLGSFSSIQKTMKDGYATRGRDTEKKFQDKLLIFGDDKKANEDDAIFVTQLLNIFTEYGDTSEPNYGIPVASINLLIGPVGDNGQKDIYLTAPGVPDIPLPQLSNFISDNVSQFIDLETDKNIFKKDQVKQFLITNFSEILPKNIAMIRKIKKWFGEFDDLKNHITPGQKPKFQSEREFFEQDKEALTYFVRQSLNILEPQTYPIFSADNYYNTENALILLDKKYRREYQQVQDEISLTEVRNLYKDDVIQYISNFIIPKLTQKYTEAIQASDDPENASFLPYDLQDIVDALTTGDMSLIPGPAIYILSFALDSTIVPSNTNNYGMTNEAATEQSLVSTDVIDYHGIQVACKPGDYTSNSGWGLRNQYSETWNTGVTLNHRWDNWSHRHMGGHRHHFWGHVAHNGAIHFSNWSFNVTHPGGETYQAGMVDRGGDGSYFATTFTGASSITNNNAGVSTNDFTNPPVYPAGTNGTTLTADNGQTYTWHHGPHTMWSSTKDSNGFGAANNNLATFLAYVGSNNNTNFDGSDFRFDDNLDKGLTVIMWDGIRWTYDNGTRWDQGQTFLPSKNDFIIGEIAKSHKNANIGALQWLGREESGGDSYHFGNRLSSTYLAGAGQGGIWSGQYRRRFSSDNGLTHWRDHGDTRGAQGFINVSLESAILPGEDDSSGVLRLTVNDRIVSQTKTSQYSGQWNGARKHHHMVGMENGSAISLFEEGKQYKIQFQARASTPGINWIFKVGDFRHGHQYPTWEFKKVVTAVDNGWHTYEIPSFTPVKRGSSGDNSIFREYGIPNNIRGQLVMGLKPFIYNQGYNAYDGVDAAVNEWVEFENIVVREL